MGACGSPTATNPSTGSSISPDSQLVVLREAYVYGLPLVLMDITRRQMTDPSNKALYSPVNQFRHNNAFPDASFRNVVRPNADTYYSISWLDLSGGPVKLSLPATNGRYYMMPLMDAWSNVFAAPGTRTTGNGAVDLLIKGPGWNGAVPAGVQEIAAPTNTVWIIGRIQVNSREDGKATVVPLQNQIRLTPFTKQAITHKPSPPAPIGDPNALLERMPVDSFFTYLNELMLKNPPPAADSPIIRRLTTVGIVPGKAFQRPTLPTTFYATLDSIPHTVFNAIRQSKTSSASLVNGWNMGTLVIGTYGTDYTSRAGVAVWGLGANLREDAIYPSCNVDQQGQPLDGNQPYVIHFPKGGAPPAQAFWSLTLYDQDGYFVNNPINRYAIGDRSQLRPNADGSIDIYVQQRDPGGVKTTNWLPAPPSHFNLLMRVYWPSSAMLQGNYIPPPVVKQ